jgi:hypothetical protein
VKRLRTVSWTVLCGIVMSCGLARAEDRPQPRSEPQATQLTFDPLQAKYLDRVRNQLALTDAELALYRRQGFVVVNQRRAYNFGTAYQHIYQCDLPVLITSASILHIMHRSFDNMLMELEEQVFYDTLVGVLSECHRVLASRPLPASDQLGESDRDVDLYVTVASNLLGGAGTNGSGLSVSSCRGQDEAVLRIVQAIGSLRLEDPVRGQGTVLYGGRRPIDYSQFKPRGHYTKSSRLQSYFRAAMWLGRPDCGFQVLPAHPESGIQNQSQRELRDAVLLIDLLKTSGQAPRLAALDHVLELLVGSSDNLRPQQLAELLDETHVSAVTDLANAQLAGRLQEALAKCPAAQQHVCGQVILASKFPGEQIPPPAVFQVLGQRFAVDAYVTGQVVYDAVRTPDAEGRFRTLPRGLDVMAALGNPEAWQLLADDLTRWQYRPQLQAAREFTAGYMTDPAHRKSVYNLWLATLTALQATPEPQANFPEAMRTEAWRRKQLHAQLGSWAELCHDARILYVKQAYTRRGECEYPAGYVEPYPEFYTRARELAQRTAEGLGESVAQFRRLAGAREVSAMDRYGGSAVPFWLRFANTMGRLETLARKHLTAEPFTVEEERFLRQTVRLQTRRQGYERDSAQLTAYDGWYCGLLYPDVQSIVRFEPTVADVHTDPNGSEVLQVGVGHTNLALVAVDNGSDHMAFVGPVYTYYEFRQAATNRMTDEEFRALLGRGQEPPRPEWVRMFEPGPAPRPTGTP